MNPEPQPQPAIAFDPVEEVLAAFARGEMVVIADDEKRENEGDLICAADSVTPEHINFMATRGRGLICVAMESATLARLGIGRPAVQYAHEHPFRTAFMESVDARDGTTTGISAADRALTIRRLVAEDASAGEFNKPGHVFPIQAHPEGVLGRPGHTEAAVDLARLAGRFPAGVICEILRDDGQMARLPELAAFARQHGLRLSSVAEIVAHRQRTEILVTPVRRVKLPTEHAHFDLVAFHSRLDQEDHLALVLGEPGAQSAPLVRLHSECLTGDVFGSLRCDCGAQLHSAQARIAAEGHGVIVYLRQEGRGIGLANKLHAYALQDEGLDTVEANRRLGFEADQRDYTLAAQMLRALGVSAVRLMTNNPAKIAGLERHGIRVAERIPLVVGETPHNRRYLDTKRAKLGHNL
jgi:3,4-dihydroxy 2-butanone 4-phosphate synthase/GTP cyclohydrolase II